MAKKKSDRMSAGERQIWAAAFVNKLSDVNEPMFQLAMQMVGSAREQARAFRNLAMEATELANLAVNAMGLAQKEMVRQKRRETSEFRRLEEMLQ